MPYANSYDSDQHVSMQSDRGILCSSTYTTYLLILQAGNKGSDQPVQMHSLIWANVVRKLQKDPFSALCFICCEYPLDICQGPFNPCHAG